MMKEGSFKSSSAEFKEYYDYPINNFLEDESLIINNSPLNKESEKDELEERRHEMLKDNRLEKYSYSRPKLKYFLDKSDGHPSAQKNSFKIFQQMTLGDTSDVPSVHSLMTPGGVKYKPKIFEILK